jgi:hypothetical protein
MLEYTEIDLTIVTFSCKEIYLITTNKPSTSFVCKELQIYCDGVVFMLQIFFVFHMPDLKHSCAFLGGLGGRNVCANMTNKF